jgi:hypothetical protein
MIPIYEESNKGRDEISLHFLAMLAERKAWMEKNKRAHGHTAHANSYSTYTRTLPQNPFRSAPFPTVWLSPPQSPILPSLLSLALPPQASSQRTHSR